MSNFAVAFIVLYICSIVASVLKDGVFGIYIYQLVYFLNPQTKWWFQDIPNIRYAFITSIAILIGYWVRKKQYQEIHFFHAPQIKWWAGMTTLMIALSLVAVAPDLHSEFTSYYIKYFMFGFFCYKIVNTPKHFEGLIWVYLTGEFYLGWLAYGIGRTNNGRLDGVGTADAPDNNFAAALILSSVPVLLFYLMEGNRWQKILAFIYIIFVCNALVLIGSRGAFVGLVVGILYFAYSILLTKSKVLLLRTKIKVLVCIVASVACFLFLADKTFWERMNTLGEINVKGGYFKSNEAVDTGADRTGLWLVALDVVRDHPLGLGVWGFQTVSRSYVPSELMGKSSIKAVHSIYFQTLVDCGYLGLAIFLMMIGSNFRVMRKAQRFLLQNQNNYAYLLGVSISAGLVSLLTAFTFIDGLYVEILYWYIIFSACFVNIFYMKTTGNKEGASVSYPQAGWRERSPGVGGEL